MTQQDILELLSKSLDEALSESEQGRLDQAFLADPSLIDLRETLARNKVFCQNLPFQEIPGNHPCPILPSSRPWYIRTSPFLAIAALLTLGSFIWIVSIQEKPKLPTPIAEKNDTEALNEHLLATQQAFKSAIDQLEQKANHRLEELPLSLQQTFRENLALVDDAIRHCESAIPNGNGHYLAYRTLSQAYEAKVRILEQILKS